MEGAENAQEFPSMALGQYEEEAKDRTGAVSLIVT